jgi:hypothetical protein
MSMLWLRWILLLAGLAFIAIIVWLERRRPGGARRGEERAGEGSTPRWNATGAERPAHDHGSVPEQVPTVLPTMHASGGSAYSDNGELPEMRAALTLPPVVMVSGGHDDVSPARDVETVEWMPHDDLDAEPIVEWPPEAERRILALRMVSAREERMSGRAVRQCLEANGFRHGRFAIFHLSGSDGRAVLSVASLTRPGVLDPENMDFLRFSGLSLFAVLPGPLEPLATFDRLVNVGQYLTTRLGARLQDDKGNALDSANIARLRQEISDQLRQAEAARPGH